MKRGYLTSVTVLPLAMALLQFSSARSCGPGAGGLGEGSRRGPQDGVGHAGPAGHLGKTEDVPLRQPAPFANKEFLTDMNGPSGQSRCQAFSVRTASRLAASAAPNRTSAARHTPRSSTHLRVGRRTSSLLDPPDGRIPPITPELSGRTSCAFQLALLKPPTRAETSSRCRGSQRPDVTATNRDAAGLWAGFNRSDNPERSQPEQAVLRLRRA